MPQGERDGGVGGDIRAYEPRRDGVGAERFQSIMESWNSSVAAVVENLGLDKHEAGEALGLHGSCCVWIDGRSANYLYTAV